MSALVGILVTDLEALSSIRGQRPVPPPGRPSEPGERGV